MHKKQKPSVLEKAQYTKVTSLLNTRVMATTKFDLKQQVKSFEKAFYEAQGTFPSRETNPEYNKLRKTLDHAKKVCQCWEDCIAL